MNARFFCDEGRFFNTIVYNNLRNLKNPRGFRALRHCAAALPAAIRRMALPPRLRLEVGGTGRGGCPKN